MSNDATRVLVRYDGGSGGDTLAWFIAQHLDHGQAQTQHDSMNRMDFLGIWPNEFKNSRPLPRNMIAYDLPDKAWREMPCSVIANTVRQMCESTQLRVGNCHHVFDRNSSIHDMFPGFTVIDLCSRAEHRWISTLLQLIKVALRQHQTEPNPAVFGRRPQFQDIKQFWQAHGWWLDYWSWNCGIIPLEDFLDDILTVLDATYPCDGDHFIDNSFLLDAELSWLPKLSDLLRISTVSATACCALQAWIQRNIGLLHDLGVSDLVGKSLSTAEQHSLIISVISKEYARLDTQELLY